LLPAHVIDPQVIDPVPVPERDRRDFETIRRATAGQLVFSRSRRDAESRQTGESPLLRGLKIDKEAYLRRERVPEHAVSEADRLLARSTEFIGEPRAKSAKACWRNWHIPELTPHDGLIRSHHPVLEQVLKRSFSATALRKLLRDPLGYVWKYAFGWDAPTDEDAPLSLDALQFGSLAHKAMEHALIDLETSGGLAKADARKIAAAAAKAVQLAAREFEAANAIPPRLMWVQTLERVRQMTEAALSWEEPPLPDQASFAEVPFGRRKADAARPHPPPWDATKEVKIPGTDLAITGWIDRLDMSGDGKRARVTDYKTGQIPKGEIVLNGGAELQRCLYAFAVQALMDGAAEVEARLLYPRDGGRLMEMDNPGAVLAEVTEYLVAARDNLREGNALIGKESGARDDDALTFALPGNAKEVYFETKMAAAAATLMPLPELWEKP
jgi:hypothetical protein